LAVFGRQTPDPTFLEAYLLGHHTKLLSCSGECPRSYAERSCVLFALLGGNRPFRQLLSQKLLGLRCCRTIPTCIGRRNASSCNALVLVPVPLFEKCVIDKIAT
jgi:hypothetical protein